MSDIKMSEKFSLVTYREKTSSILNGDESIALLTGDHGIGSAIVHAINNHDRLTEENAKLKEDNAELISFVESVANCHAIIGIGDEDVSDKGRARKLLNKHKEQSNA